MKKVKSFIFVLAGAVAAAAAAGLAFSQMQRTPENVDAPKEFERMSSRIDVIKGTAAPAPLDPSDTEDLYSILPDLTDKDLAVKGKGDIELTVFCSPEKAGDGNDGWMKELAETFNSQRQKTRDGRTVSVTLYNVSSGLGADYITSGKYTPDLYSPSSAAWGAMLKENGSPVQEVLPQTVSNTAGVVIREAAAKKIEEKYKTASIENLIRAAAAGEVSIGYTDPYTSTAGLNFLTIILRTFDSKDMFSEKAIKGLQDFQSHVPMIGVTTQQMVKAADNNMLDGFVCESQTWNTAIFRYDGWRFIPYGQLHQNPLYSMPSLSKEKQEAIELFASTLRTDDAKRLAENKGFGTEKFSGTEALDGKTLLNAQSLWKREKDSGRPAAAIFVADTSGSMTGDPIRELRRALVNVTGGIDETNYIGLVSYSDQIVNEVPLAKFDLQARARFKGAVQNLNANGGTSTYSALAAACYEMTQFLEQHEGEGIRPVIILLSDGESNDHRLKFRDLEAPLRSAGYPVCCIGYNTVLSELEDLAGINEAPCLQANSEDVVYRIRQLFNAAL